MSKKTSTRKGIGYSSFTDKIYLGRQNKEKGMWIGDKEDITSDFLNVLFQYIDSNKVRKVTTIDGLTENLFFNIQLDKKSIKKAIKYLKKKLTELS